MSNSVRVIASARRLAAFDYNQGQDHDLPEDEAIEEICRTILLEDVDGGFAVAKAYRLVIAHRNLARPGIADEEAYREAFAAYEPVVGRVAFMFENEETGASPRVSQLLSII